MVSMVHRFRVSIALGLKVLLIITVLGHLPTAIAIVLQCFALVCGTYRQTSKMKNSVTFVSTLSLKM